MPTNKHSETSEKVAPVLYDRKYFFLPIVKKKKNYQELKGSSFVIRFFFRGGRNTSEVLIIHSVGFKFIFYLFLWVRFKE